jgi:cysteine-S-conjugate beta-lyase
MAIDLRVPDLEALHQRAGQKWAAYEPDVLSATIAEMDFPPAPPVAEVLHRAIDRGDFGYAPRARSGLLRSFAGFASGSRRSGGPRRRRPTSRGSTAPASGWRRAR